MASDKSWVKICTDYHILAHDFATAPFILSSAKIKTSCQDFKNTSGKEVRILCKQDSRENRPKIFRENDLFLLPVKNGEYAIIRGEGYVDIPDINSPIISYDSKLSFSPDTSKIGNSEMQHLDYAYATSLIRSFMNDDSLVLTIRGRKYTPEFSFFSGTHKTRITVKGVQTEVDAGYESGDKVLLVEAKNSSTNNVIIRQMYYPFRQWQEHTDKRVHLIFFEKRGECYCIWRFAFGEIENYNSVQFVNSARFSIASEYQ